MFSALVGILALWRDPQVTGKTTSLLKEDQKTNFTCYRMLYKCEVKTDLLIILIMFYFTYIIDPMG